MIPKIFRKQPETLEKPAVSSQPSSLSKSSFYSPTMTSIVQNDESKNANKPLLEDNKEDEKAIRALNEPEPIYGNTPLINEILQENFERCKKFIENEKVLINQHSYKMRIKVNNSKIIQDTYSPFLIAIRNNFNEILELFFKRKDFNINAKTPVTEISPLYCAINHNNPKAAGIILDNMRNCLDINIQTDSGVRPLFMAVIKSLNNQEYIEIVKKILSYPQVDIFYAKFQNASPFMASHKNSETSLLLKNNIKENYLINFYSPIKENIEKYLNKDALPFSQFEKLIPNYRLDKLIKTTPSIKFIQFNKAGMLYNESTTEKIALMRCNDATIFVDFYDYDFFIEYIFTDYRCPIIRNPLSSKIDFTSPDFFSTSYILNKNVFSDLASALNT